MASDSVRFATLTSEGKEINVRYLKHEDIRKCPSYILVPEHYREDGSCKHNEKTCEFDECEHSKYRREIYCKEHCVVLFGADL